MIYYLQIQSRGRESANPNKWKSNFFSFGGKQKFGNNFSFLFEQFITSSGYLII